MTVSVYLTHQIPAVVPRFRLLTATPPPVKNSLLKSVLSVDLGKIELHYGLFACRSFYLLVDASSESVLAGSISLGDARTPGSSFFCRKLLNHELRCSEMLEQIFTSAVKVSNQFFSFYLYSFIASRGVREALDSVCKSCFQV